MTPKIWQHDVSGGFRERGNLVSNVSGSMSEPKGSLSSAVVTKSSGYVQLLECAGSSEKQMMGERLMPWRVSAMGDLPSQAKRT
jgi:hypothetical protein